jgi:biotin-(acetyl-CoA carboxylase) ligase
MNCLQQAGHFPVALRAKATSLEICCPEAVDRAAVAAAVVARLDHWFSRPRGEWDATVRAWRDLCDDFGRHIELSRNDRRFTGTVIDIETNGDLILEVDRGGRQSFGAATTARGW